MSAARSLPARSAARRTIAWPLIVAACAPAGAGDVGIAEVQGPAATSPHVGGTITVTGIVTGDFQDGDANELDNLGGFYVQSEQPDRDSATSEGLFVYEGRRSAVDVVRGQRVRVSGTVQEHFGETQLKADGVEILGVGTVDPVPLGLPASDVVRNADGAWIADLEAYEGMLVKVTEPLTVTGLRHLERFGSVELSAGGRLYQFTNVAAPAVSGFDAWRMAAASRFMLLDDGKRDSNPVPLRHLGAPGARLRIGHTVAGLTGVLRYARGSGGSGEENWRLVPVVPPVFSRDNPRPPPPDKPGNLRVAGFNVANYFSGLDDGKPTCGPDGTHGCRGADGAREQARQLGKIATALAMLDADIVGLVELENNASASLGEIVAAVNLAGNTRRYHFVDTGVIGRDTIKAGFIYTAATVRPVGQHALLTARDDLRFDDSRNRPALAQTFEHAGGDRLTIVVNHLKSKGSDCNEEKDPNTGDGQGNCNLTRTRAMAALANWLSADPTVSKDPDYLVIGDFNAYLREDPARVFEETGFVNLLANESPPAYSYVYDARSGALDHAYASAALAPAVLAARAWHINADEAPVHDYNLEFGRDAAIFDANSPWRSSDHDPIVIDLRLPESAGGVAGP